MHGEVVMADGPRTCCYRAQAMICALKQGLVSVDDLNAA